MKRSNHLKRETKLQMIDLGTRLEPLHFLYLPTLKCWFHTLWLYWNMAIEAHLALSILSAYKNFSSDYLFWKNKVIFQDSSQVLHHLWSLPWIPPSSRYIHRPSFVSTAPHRVFVTVLKLIVVLKLLFTPKMLIGQ